MTVSQVTSQTVSRLEPRYGHSEAVWMMRIIMDHLKGYSLTDLIMYGDRSLGEATCTAISNIVDRLLKGEPLQYIIGKARFYGMDFTVTPDVLIPRPETEELIDIIVDREKDTDDLRVADLGTGSGCIAIALARNLPFSKVTAVDISDKALSVASANAAALKANVQFLHDDILSMTLPRDSFDIIVSNPPYIMEREKSTMETNVLDHEPATALFVPDSDPLRFYLAIARIASSALTDGGRLYFELNPLTADDLAARLTGSGWQDVTLLPDSRKKTRFLTATLHRQ